jgi:FkbM family methyltransferase
MKVKAKKAGVFNPEIDILPTLAGVVKGKRSIDVGANRGEFTAALRKAGFEVDSFEPFADLVSDLESRFKSDKYVRIHQTACSNKDSIGRFYRYSAVDPKLDNTLFSTLHPHPTYEGLAAKQHSYVELRRLDTIFKDQLGIEFGILKIDTEGHDVMVLEGASNIKSETVLVEFWDEKFIFNQGKVANRLIDYQAAIDSTIFPFNILFWRGSNPKHYGFICNAEVSPPMSWGNILYLRNSDAMEAVKKFCLKKYGPERMAERQATLPVMEDNQTELLQSDSNIDSGDKK